MSFPAGLCRSDSAGSGVSWKCLEHLGTRYALLSKSDREGARAAVTMSRNRALPPTIMRSTLRDCSMAVNTAPVLQEPDLVPARCLASSPPAGPALARFAGSQQ